MKSSPRAALKLSFEFFPPRTPDAAQNLRATLGRLEGLGAHYCSVTYGAGGSARDQTLETALTVRAATGADVAPHISCAGSSEDELRRVIQSYQDNGFNHLVALRGDLPSGLGGAGSLRYARDLVALIRRETGAHFHIEVGCYPECHPQTDSAAQDLEHFRIKVAAGADSAITQYFYNADAYFRFLESCAQAGIDIPVVPGVMPITNRKQLVRFSKACGAEIPRWILARLNDFGDDLDSIREFGLDVITRLCARLLEGGAPGLHIYTMNRWQASVSLWQALGLNADAT